MENLLAGKHVFITGAGAGIGRAIALDMAAQGAHIYFAELNSESCAATERELRASGARAQGYVCDVSNSAAIDKLCDSLNSNDVAVDVLVNNVGVNSKTVTAQVESDSFSKWQLVMNTNLIGPLYLTERLTNTMKERGTAGNVIFITSLHQWQPMGDAIYSASKAGVGMLVKELAVSLAPANIRVNGIAPGRALEAGDGSPMPQEKTPLYHQTVPYHYISRAALFLASDYFSRHTTGTILKVDGGLSLYSFATQNVITPVPTPSLPRRIARRGKLELKQLRERLR